MQAVIFEPFARVLAAGESAPAGVGIGLALVKRLAELHGGTASVESSGPGTGSEFVVRLPLVEPPSAPPEASEAGPRPRARRGLSIVVAEDNPDVAQSLAIALEQAGHRVQLFADGPSALSGLASLKPAAVLLDIGLPGMDGYELAARLRRKRNLQHTLFIAISGFKQRVYAGKAGGDFDHYFVKPVDAVTLLTLLDTHAGAREDRAATVRQAPKKQKARRVLVVEDHAELAAVTAELLRQEGLEVRTALSGREAMEIAEEFRPELVLCDLHLPDMPGEELVRALRASPGGERARVVILTALHESQIASLRRGAKQVGIDQFLSKPLTPEKLRAELARLKSR
jgi:CheY-like chemotaxis protein